MKSPIRVLLLASLLAVGVSRAGTDTNSARGFRGPAEMESFLDGLFSAQLEALHIPGATVAVVADGQLYFAKGYGYADLERRRKVDPDRTLFRVGSVTKLFTWTAVMQLVEQGKLDLKADVNSYLKAFKVPATYPEQVTLTHLLTHTAGFEDRVLGLFSWDPASLKPFGQTLAAELPTRVRPPGQLSVYSNHGASLAGYIVQEVSGVPWEDYVEKNILEPLDMKHSTVRQPVPPALSPDVVVGYKYAGGRFEPQGFDFVPTRAAGSVSASACDMARFMIAHLQNGRLGERRILSEATARTMHSRLFAHSPELSAMLYGFIEGSVNGERTIGHTGGMVCCLTRLMLLPDRNTGVFVSYNCPTAAKALGDFQKTFMDHYYPAPDAAEPPPPKPALERVARCAGEYSSLRRSFTSLTKLAAIIGTVKVRVDSEGYLVTTGAGAGVRKWVELDPLVFRESPGQERLAFRADSTGQITHLFLDEVPCNAWIKLRWYETSLFQNAIVGISLLVIGSGLVVWPIAAVCGRRRRIPESPPRAARLAAWVMGGLFVLLFLCLGVTALVPMQFVFGVPRLIRGALWCPLVAIPFLAATVLFALHAWTRRYWTAFGRLHYSLVTLAGLVLLGWLQYWNLLGFHY